MTFDGFTNCTPPLAFMRVLDNTRVSIPGVAFDRESAILDALSSLKGVPEKSKRFIAFLVSAVLCD